MVGRAKLSYQVKDGLKPWFLEDSIGIRAHGYPMVGLLGPRISFRLSDFLFQ